MIILHAASAVACFITGVLIISPVMVQKYKWLMPTFLVSLSGLIIFMVGAMIAHWYELTGLEKGIFTGLVVLACYMLYRAIHARKLFQASGVSEKYIDDVGFTLISLFNGFIIVALIDLSAPAWSVAAGAILATIVGTKLIAQTKRRYLHLPVTPR